jgi:hypothetical protein
MSERITLIIAPSYQRARAYAEKNELGGPYPHDRDGWRYASRAEHLMGLSGPQIRLVILPDDRFYVYERARLLQTSGAELVVG